VAGVEAYLRGKFHLDPSNRLATIHQRHRQRDRTDIQQSDSIRRTVLQTVVRRHNSTFKAEDERSPALDEITLTHILRQSTQR